MLNVLLEAGADLNGAALEAAIVDKLILFYAPKIMGTGGVPMARIASTWFPKSPALTNITVNRFGPDFCVQGYFHDVYGNHRAAGKIDSFDHGPEGGRLRISLAGAPAIAAEMKLGDSISVNGCCLTVIEFDENSFRRRSFRRNSSPHILRRKKARPSVNLERPLAARARLGGHFVQGHVDGIGRVTRLAPEGDNWWLSVRVPEDLRRYVAEKGSIAIDGISLTVARWHAQDGIADIAIIPFTHQHTNVRAMVPGDAVNLEADILAKYVESLLAARNAKPASHFTVGDLIEEGF